MVRFGLALMVVVSVACADSDPMELDDPCSEDKARTITVSTSDDGFMFLVERCRNDESTCDEVCEAVFTPGAENEDWVTDCEVEHGTDEVRVSGRVHDFAACDG